MGKVWEGIPQNIALGLIVDYGLRIFVETGTFEGRTAAWAADNFDLVITIEKNQRWQQYAMEKYDAFDNIRFLVGDSREELPRVLSRLSDRALIWLDAHWTRNVLGQEMDCPIRQELKALAHCNHKHIVMIDDAHFWQGEIPEGGNAYDWVQLDEMQELLPGYTWEVKDDVVICRPLEVQ